MIVLSGDTMVHREDKILPRRSTPVLHLNTETTTGQGTTNLLEGATGRRKENILRAHQITVVHHLERETIISQEKTALLRSEGGSIHHPEVDILRLGKATENTPSTPHARPGTPALHQEGGATDHRGRALFHVREENIHRPGKAMEKPPNNPRVHRGMTAPRMARKSTICQRGNTPPAFHPSTEIASERSTHCQDEDGVGRGAAENRAGITLQDVAAPPLGKVDLAEDVRILLLEEVSPGEESLATATVLRRRRRRRRGTESLEEAAPEEAALAHPPSSLNSQAETRHTLTTRDIRAIQTRHWQLNPVGNGYGVLLG
jgi:hypothetical protein